MALCDENEVYCARLSEYLRSHLSLGFEIHSFTDIGILESFSRTNEISLLVISEKSMSALEALGEKENYKNILVLEEGSKYRPAGVILERIAQFCAEKSDDFRELYYRGGAESSTVLGFFTPASGLGQTSLCLKMGKELAESKKTVLLSFESFSALSMTLSPEADEDITDLIYHAECDRENFCLYLEKIKRSFEGFDIVPPAATALQIREITAEKLKNLIMLLTKDAGYEYILMDIKEYPEGFFDILGLCDTIYTLKGTSAGDVYRYDKYRQVVSANGYEEILSKTRLVDAHAG